MVALVLATVFAGWSASLDAGAPRDTLDGVARDTLDVELPDAFLSELLGDDSDEAMLLLEHLQSLAAWKIDLNGASGNDLLQLPGLSLSDLALLLAFRETNESFRSKEDLLSAGLAAETVASLLPFVSFESHPPEEGPAGWARRLRVEVLHRWTRRLDTARGFRDGRYLGSPDALSTRIRLRDGNRIHAGAILDHDAGEPFRWKPEDRAYGYDHASGFVEIERLGPFRRLILGDFAVRAGEGLLLHQGAAFTAGVGTSAPRPGRVLRPHTSSSEVAFFRGSAIESRTLGGVGVTAFLSQRYVTARIDSAGHFTIVSTGLHRTTTEMTNRRALRESAAGMVLSYDSRTLTAGAAVYAFRHETDRLVEHSRPLPTAFVALRRRDGHASFETALRDGAVATSLTLEYERRRIAGAWIRRRHAPPNSAVLHTSIATTGSGRSRAETLYEGTAWMRPGPSWKLSYFWRRLNLLESRMPFPSPTLDRAILVEYGPRRWLQLTARYSDRHFEKTDTCPAESHRYRCAATHRRRALRLQGEYQHSRMLRLRIRIEQVLADGPVDRPLGAWMARSASRGFLLFEEIRWQPSGVLQLDLRLAYFDVDHSDARVYTFENDLLYSFSSPSFSGRGRRAYALLRWSPRPPLMIQLKVAMTRYEDIRAVGSGRDEIPGSRVRDLKTQLRWTFN